MMSFQYLGLSTPLLKAVKQLGFERPTEVQQKVIPTLLRENTDLIALAQTGTGKTAAFGFPLLQQIDPEACSTQGLVLAPTRELCLQITSELTAYGQLTPRIKIVAVYGGANISEQARKIKQGAHIVAATPGRLKDMLRRNLVNIDSIRYCILDEADEMLNMGFYEDIKDILGHTPKEKKSWLFSATMPPEVNKIAGRFMSDPVEITVGAKNAGAKNISHEYYIVGGRERYQALRAILSLNVDIFGCVFCRTKIETQKVAEKLIQDGYKAAAIHGDLSQNQRDVVMDFFRRKRIQLLVATDVAARGIDVNNVTHIINYQLPDEVETYTHRSGRTGRAGKEGVSIILATRSDRRKIKLIENKLQTKMKEAELPSEEIILKSQINNWIRAVKETSINSKIQEYLPEAMTNFEELSKEALVTLLLSKEIKTFEPIMTASTGEGDQLKHSKYSDRFYINLGSRDRYEWMTLKDFLRSFLSLQRDAIFKVEVMKSFSFFSADRVHREQILNKFDDLVIDNRKISVELTKKKRGYKSDLRKKVATFK